MTRLEATLQAIQPEAKAPVKYKSGWLNIGGQRMFLHSFWEKNFAHYLQWLKDQKQIQAWKYEPRVFWFEGIRRGITNYTPDFWVLELDGRETWYEIKGYMDSKSATKIKRFRKFYPDLKLIVIDKAAYRAIQKKCRGLVPGWDTPYQESEV